MVVIVVVGVIVAVCVLLVLCVGAKLERWYRTPKELRGDWWPKFEHEFRVYVRRNSAPRNTRPRPRDREHFDR